MPKMEIKRSKVINAPIDKVYNIVSNLGEWQKWSPWLIMEPEAKVEVRDDQKYYTWDGQRVGSGEMQITSENGGDEIAYDLTFLKPWKSKAKVGMHLKSVAEGTQVNWTMDSSLPWFMFWMKKMMEAYVGSDYERGLNLLKDYAENGAVHSKINHLGTGTYPGCNYIAITRNCSMDEVSHVMEADFNRLMDFANTNPGFRPQDALSIYHKWNFKNKRVKYTAAVPYDQEPGNLPEGISKGKIPEIKTYTVEHVGPYQHLGNAWSTLYAMHRNKEFKPVRNIHPFETYGNNPKDTAPKDLITRIHFAVK